MSKRLQAGLPNTSHMRSHTTASKCEAAPALAWAIWMPRCRKSATCTKSASRKPRVVRAGVPTRMPPGTTALWSPGTLFLFRVMWARSST